MAADLVEMITDHFGVAPAELTSALESLPAIRRHAATLSGREAALFDDADFPEDEDAYARVTLDSLGRTAKLISTAYSASKVAEILGVNPSRVRQRRADRTLWAIEDRGGWIFPALQFDDVAGRKRHIRNLDQVFRALPVDLHPLAVAGFLTSTQADLKIDRQSVSPLDWLRSGGEVRAVLDCVEAADCASR